jgi:dihydroorotate dehydrogenase
MKVVYEKILRPLLFHLDAESAHHFAMFWLAHLPPAVVRMLGAHELWQPREVFGLKFANPIGLAAGFDKNALALNAWELLGFGFVEAGTITAKAQPGNPPPRLFRLPEQHALINRMGFNNDGSEVVAARLEAQRAAGKWPHIPIGINLGKSKVTPLEEAPADYLQSFERLFDLGDYFVLNVSSPNTPGLRELQAGSALDELLRVVQAANFAKVAPKPLLVKLAPDLEWPQLDEILALAEAHRVAGIVATNTTIDHASVPAAQRQQGGLSGAPLRVRSTEIVKHITSQSKLPVIAAGGIMDADSALEKFEAGAVLLQLYTGFVYRGPALLREIGAALARVRA